MIADDRLTENDRFERGRKALRLAFGTPDPKITGFPHCIFPQSAGSFRSVVAAIGEPVAGWGNTKPAVDATGDNYLEPPDSRIIGDFWLWRLPENQQVIERAAGCLNVGFTMVISANTSEEVLSRMYAGDIGEDQFEYYKCISLLPDWIEDLGWAYVPLAYESVFTMFVTARRNQPLVEGTRARLAMARIEPVFEVASCAGRQEWRGPLYVE